MKTHFPILVISTLLIAGCSESQSTEKQAQVKKEKVVQITLQTVIRQGGTVCSQMRSMQKVQVMERVNNPYVQMPPDCHIAAQPIPVQIHGDDPMGFVVVFNENGRGLVQKKDLETMQIRN
ncbi:hypothetical protein [Oxalicibacterium faecigallinarum]|nr:hypothetical protein [Oxalicibacterium faecigallinarum]